jgi:DNA sulfur modification protein DndD
MKIDKNYTVYPVDGDGNRQTSPSAAGQQLLTLALISGLNTAAVHDAPMVIDTPFGKVDLENRERMLKWLQGLVSEKQQQVILLVHSGEVTREDLVKWRITPGRSYHILTEDRAQHRILPD